MSEMDAVDRIAWALVRRTAAHYGDIVPEQFDLTLSRELARAALAAIRQPTEPMLAAGLRGCYGMKLPEDIWGAMIDAALSSPSRSSSDAGG